MNLDTLRDPFDRRSFVERCARLAFGLTVLPALGPDASAADPATKSSGPGFGKAKRIIVLNLGGGLSHIDSFDPKSGDVKGPGDAIQTNAPFQVTSYLPEIQGSSQ